MKINAFTLVELAVTAVIVGMLGMMAIPSMLGMMNRSYAQDAMNNLIAIYAAQQNYSQSHGGVYIAAATTAAINNNLDLNIVPTGGITYSCALNGGTFTCTTAGRFVMGVSSTNPVNITQAVPLYCAPGPAYAPNNPCCTLIAGKNPGDRCP